MGLYHEELKRYRKAFKSVGASMDWNGTSIKVCIGHATCILQFQANPTQRGLRRKLDNLVNEAFEVWQDRQQEAGAANTGPEIWEVD